VPTFHYGGRLSTLPFSNFGRDRKSQSSNQSATAEEQTNHNPGYNTYIVTILIIISTSTHPLCLDVFVSRKRVSWLQSKYSDNQKNLVHKQSTLRKFTLSFGGIQETVN